MDDRDNYAVIGLIHYDALISELAVLRHENQQLRQALDSAVAKHQEVQERIAAQDEAENE